MSLHPFCSKPHDKVSGTPGMETLWQVKMKPSTLFIMFLFFQSTLVRVDGLFLKIPRLSRRSYVDKKLQISGNHYSTYDHVGLVGLWSSPNDNNNEKDPFLSYSLEWLALTVSLFFVATVFLVGGDKLLVTPPPSSERTVIDADELLRNEFDRVSSYSPQL